MHISGNDFELSIDDLRKSNPQLAIDWPLSGGGSADSLVEYVLSQYDITCDHAQAVAYLKPYGAWDDDELLDHDANMARLVWLIGCDLGESGEAYLSAY